jgi:peptidoglycan/LPS O-acetylase OafA/YrhL
MEAGGKRPGVRHIAYIDGLRAVAVLAVIAYHLNPSWLPGGFTGVDVFFVISGFVVSASLANFDKPGLWTYLTYFYSRRLRRIAPALVVCLLVTAVGTALFVPAAWLSNTNDGTGLRAFVGLSNFWLADTSGEYFSPKTEFNPYTHTWSLGVEEQFYLVFPVLFFAWSYFRSKRRLSVALFAAALTVSLLFAARTADTAPTDAFYMLTCRFWELAAGSLLFQVLTLRADEREASPRRWRTAAAGLSAVALAAGLWTARESHTPFPDGVLPVLGTLGLLGFLFSSAAADPVRRALETRGPVQIGKISYSLYLWHWPIFVLFRWTAGLETLATRSVALALTFAAATASYRLVERPFRYSPRLVRAPRFAVIVVGLAAVVASAMVYRGITHEQPRLSLSTVSAHAADWYPDERGARGGAPVCADPVAPGDLHGGRLVTYSRACGNPVARASVFVVGDSHALSYDAMLREVAARTGRDVHMYSKAGCAVLSLRPDYRVPGCGKFGVKALRDMAGRARKGDILFLPSLRTARLTESWTRSTEAAARREMFSPAAAAGRREAEGVAAQLLEPLVARGVRVVFEGPTPVFRAPPFRCGDWFNRRNPICRGGLSIERSLVDSLRAPVLASFANVAEQVGGVSVWDPYPILCPGQRCHAIRDGRPLFFDGDHVSGYANRVLLPSFVAHLGRVDSGASLPPSA